MKKAIVALLFLAALGAVAAAILPRVFSSETVKTALMERAREITGREMDFSGTPRFVFSPFIGIEIRDVTFRGFHQDAGSQPILSMPLLQARIGLAAALSGKVSIEEFRFVRPLFNLRILASGQTNWSFPTGKVWRVLEQARELREKTETGSSPDIGQIDRIVLGSFTIADGVINYMNETSGRTETVTNFNGSLNWPNSRAAWTFTGGGIWRGDAFRLTTAAEQPIMLLSGGASKMIMSLDSQPLTISFNGEANRFSDLFMSGRVSASSPSLRRLAGLFGTTMKPGSTLSEFSAEGTITGTFSQVQLNEAVVQLDGNRGTGSLFIAQAPGAPIRISGTLAYQSLDATAYREAFRAGPPPAGEAAADNLGEAFRNASVDLRLSAGEVRLGSLTMRDFAGSVTGKNAGLIVDIGNLHFNDGLVVGAIESSADNGRTVLACNMQMSGIDLSALASILGNAAILPAGAASIGMKLRSTSGPGDSLASNLNGEITFAMKDGALKGVVLRKANGAAEGSGSAAQVSLGGQTPVRNVSLKAIVNDGVAWITEGGFDVNRDHARLTGKLDIGPGSLALWGVMTDKVQDGDGEFDWSKASQFFIGGTLAQPLFVPETLTGFPVERVPVNPLAPSGTLGTTN